MPYYVAQNVPTCPYIDKLSHTCPVLLSSLQRLTSGVELLAPHRMRRPRHANIFIAAMVVLGFAEFLTVAVDWHSSSLKKFFCYLLITVAGSLLKVKLPAVTGTMSLNFLFVLVAITELTVPDALFIGCIATLIQSLWRTRSNPRLLQVVFNIMTITVAVTLTGCVSGAEFLRGLGPNDPIRLAVGACVYFIANTF